MSRSALIKDRLRSLSERLIDLDNKIAQEKSGIYCLVDKVEELSPPKTALSSRWERPPGRWRDEIDADPILE